MPRNPIRESLLHRGIFKFLALELTEQSCELRVRVILHADTAVSPVANEEHSSATPDTVQIESAKKTTVNQRQTADRVLTIIA